MSKIICITTGLTGILNASLELLARLQKEGHKVEYAAPRAIGHRLEQEGILFFELPEILNNPEPPIPTAKEKMGKWKRWWYKIKNRKERSAQALENTRPKAFKEMVRQKSPDLLIIDIELHEYIFQAYQMKVDFVLLSQWFSLWQRKGLPYLLKDTIPGKGFKGSQLWMDINWWKVKVKRWWIFNKKRWRSGGNDRRSTLLKLAKEMDFPLTYIRQNFWPGPFTYADLPVWSMTAFEMEFPHVPRPNLTYLGPMIYVDRIEGNPKSHLGFSIEEVLEYKNNKGAKLIYCSISTLKKGDVNFLKKVISACTQTKSYVLIASAGGKLELSNFQSVPENVFLFSFVPQLKILKHANLSINHGGIHTINECIHFEVPMLVYSGKRSDQNGCAARVAYHGLGLMGDKDVDDTKEIQNKIAQVISDNYYKKKIEALKEKCSHYQSSGVLPKMIGDLVSQ